MRLRAGIYFVGMGRRGGVGKCWEGEGGVVSYWSLREGLRWDEISCHVSRLDDMDRTELHGMRYDE